MNVATLVLSCILNVVDVVDHRASTSENMAIIFSAISLDIIALIVILTGVAYGYVKYVYSYWERRGVKCLKPTFPLGNFVDSFLQRVSVGESVEKMYYQTNEPFVGIYATIRPILLVRDSALVRRILVKDFQHFPDRGMYLVECICIKICCALL